VSESEFLNLKIQHQSHHDYRHRDIKVSI